MSELPPFDDADGVAPAEPKFFGDRPQRLRLHHLFVLTAVMAVLLAINGPQRNNYAYANYELPPALRMLWLVVGIAHTILSATALTALGYGIVGYRRGLRFFDQPGHWLLVEISLIALFGIVPGLGYRLIGNIDSSKLPTMGDQQMQILMILMGYSVLVLVLGRMALNIYLGKSKCNERRWKSVFYTKALAAILFGLGDPIVGLVMIHALRADRRQQVTRDAFHWCGVAIQLALISLTFVSVASMILNMFVVFH